MRTFLLTPTLLVVVSGLVFSQSLDEASRQEKARRTTLTRHSTVITNDELSRPALARSFAPMGPATAEATTSATQKLASADQTRKQILAQKQVVSSLETRVAEINKRLAPPENVGGVHVDQVVAFSQPMPGLCNLADTSALTQVDKEWCNEPDRLRAELKDLEKKLTVERSKLSAMQDEARKAGFGSAIYDPD